MRINVLTVLYKLTHPGVKDEKIPYWYKRSIMGELWHIIRKGICQNIAPNCVLTPVRLWLYRLCGFKIGKNVFIGTKCYFDDLEPQNMIIEDNVGISYGVYFSCHGKKQGHNKIIIRNDAHIGFRASILARCNIEIGERAMVGAMSFVNKSVPADTTVAGVPAKIIKNEGYSPQSNTKINPTHDKITDIASNA